MSLLQEASISLELKKNPVTENTDELDYIDVMFSEDEFTDNDDCGCEEDEDLLWPEVLKLKDISIIISEQEYDHAYSISEIKELDLWIKTILTGFELDFLDYNELISDTDIEDTFLIVEEREDGKLAVSLDLEGFHDYLIEH